MRQLAQALAGLLADPAVPQSLGQSSAGAGGAGVQPGQDAPHQLLERVHTGGSETGFSECGQTAAVPGIAQRQCRFIVNLRQRWPG